MIGIWPIRITITSPSACRVIGADFAALNARAKASLASRARSSAGLLPRGPSNVNTGASPKRTTAEAEAGIADALGAIDADALGGGAMGAALVADDALGAGTRAGAGTGGGSGTGAAISDRGSGAGWGSGGGSGSGAAAEAEAEADAGADARAADAADDDGRPMGEDGRGGE